MIVTSIALAPREENARKQSKPPKTVAFCIICDSKSPTINNQQNSPAKVYLRFSKENRGHPCKKMSRRDGGLRFPPRFLIRFSAICVQELNALLSQPAFGLCLGLCGFQKTTVLRISYFRDH